MAGVANRRQQQWETQLEDSVFLKGAIKPIVDDMTALKPPVPYALRQALKHMNKTIYFQDNGYGGGGAAGPAHGDALYEYADWASRGLRCLLLTKSKGRKAWSATSRRFHGMLSSRSSERQRSVMMGVRRRQLRYLTSTWSRSASLTMFGESICCILLRHFEL